MDVVFILGTVVLWGAMVLLIWGFQKLDNKVGGRS